MNTLIVYYSRTGHNEEMARLLHEQVGGDIDEIVDLKNREGMFGCVMAAIFKSKTRIRFAKDPGQYDQVLVVSPLWGGLLPPATRTYLTDQRTKINQLAFLSVCGKGEENTNALTDITGTAKQRPYASLLLKEAEVHNEVSKRRYADFVEHLPH